MTSAKQPGASSPLARAAEDGLWQRAFPFLMGAWLAVVFAKFGNPVIFSELLDPPKTFLEWSLNSWPTSWAYLGLGVAVIFGLAVWQWKSAAPKWVLVLPLLWFGWQLLSACQTVDGKLTRETLSDFAACAICFYLGLFCLGRMQNRAPLWFGLLAGFLFCLWVAVGQHFGGLEETRRFVGAINWDLYPAEMKAKLTSPEFEQKMASDRIFGTFVYPNALAGGIILALPLCLVGLWHLGLRFPFIVRGVLVGTLGYLGLACLFWSGSKAGWLIVLGMASVAFLHLSKLGRKLKLAVMLFLVLAGLAGFYAKYSGYFGKKNNSAVARMDYWHAAWQMLKEKPLLGYGPGTFKVGYQRLKRPESEPTKLAHNDYLQQGSDSGLIGLATYFAMVAGSVAALYRRIRLRNDPITFAVWLGVAGLAVQELVEFSLYIPALAWPFFLFLGWLWGAVEGGEHAP